MCCRGKELFEGEETEDSKGKIYVIVDTVTMR